MGHSFVKMHGCGNDFILLDDRDDRLDASISPSVVRKLCDRRLGIGADGLILVRNSKHADFGWRFFNSDGSIAELCGNGARCAARYAYMTDVAPREMTLETLTGILRAVVVDDRRVKIEMPQPRDLSMDEQLFLGGERLSVSVINTGVPHAVVFVGRLDDFPILTAGRALRNHERFQPGGSNADFVRVLGGNQLAIRTYERGVEDETLACGTGAVAAALVGIKRNGMQPPISVVTKSGERLTVHAAYRSDSEFGQVFLEGATTIAFQGCISAELFFSTGD
ncbi:MAG: diaminopimelate epimerase [Deltaproteobacteria bacterium]|nr:diaminopimelate epimerase [Deltaproteobacteria bacterium]